MHARKQLAFGMRAFHVRIHGVHHHQLDMWWLGLALFLLCIIEVCCPPFIFPLSLINRILSVINSRTKAMQHGLTFLTSVSRYHVRSSRVDGTVVFELVSAYGGVGLSLGVPYVSSPISLLMDPPPLMMNTGQLLLLWCISPTF